jgi:uncharacterized protein
MRLSVRVHPGAKHSGITGWMSDGTLKLSVGAPAEGGRANAEALDVLASALGIERRVLALVRGHGARSKLVDVAGMDEAEVRRRLELHAPVVARKPRRSAR